MIRGGATVYDGTDWKFSYVKIYDGSTWQRMIPWVYDGTQWVKSGGAGVNMVYFVPSGSDNILDSSGNYFLVREN